MLLNCFYIFVGAGLGALSRYGIQQGVGRLYSSLPLGTVLANLIGCFVIGYLLRWMGAMPEPLRLGIVTGFLGALTTMSSFAFDINTLMKAHNWAGLGVVFGLTIVGGIFMCWVGMRLAHISG